MAFGLGGYMLFQQGGEYTKGEDVYSDLADFVEISVSEKTPAPTPKKARQSRSRVNGLTLLGPKWILHP